MTRSDYYYKKAKQTIQNRGSKTEDQVIADLRDVLFEFLPSLPASLRHDIIHYYLDRWLDRPEAERSLYDLAEAPRGFVDLFHGDLQALDRDFEPEEWMLVKETLDASAGEMDMDLLEKIARLLVERGTYDR